MQALGDSARHSEDSSLDQKIEAVRLRLLLPGGRRWQRVQCLNLRFQLLPGGRRWQRVQRPTQMRKDICSSVSAAAATAPTVSKRARKECDARAPAEHED